MLFNSYGFICVFLPLTFAGFFILGRSSRRLGAAWLALASLFFYGWWSWRYVPLLLASTAFNFCAGYLLDRFRDRREARILVALAIGANLGLLGYFKYADFFIGAANLATGTLWQPLNLVLPLGISFFTFTQIAFLVDVRRGLAVEYDFTHYLLFVTYFPHLIAGPILHHRQVMPQFDEPVTYRPRLRPIAMGLTLFTLGLAKKVLLADSFGVYSDPVFDAARDGMQPHLLAAWAGALAYTLQLYFDFSGYSDMAIGISLMLGIRLPFNFASPYRAASIIEFWRRWHMSLSRFLRDYLYIPLGGNRKGGARRCLNVLATMLLGGLWHGAQWTFVAWGGLHGLYILVNMAWRKLRGAQHPQRSSRGGRILGGLLTFLCVVIAWVLFRASSFGAATAMLSGMAGLNGISLPRPLEAISLLHSLGDLVVFDGAFAGIAAMQARGTLWSFAALLAAGLLIVFVFPNSQEFLGIDGGDEIAAAAEGGSKWWRPTRAWGLTAGVLLAVTMLGLSTVSSFLYYQF